MHLLSMVLMFELCRILFYLYNFHHFTDVKLTSFLYYMFVGLRFDVSAIILINIPFILVSILPFGKQTSIYRRYVPRLTFLIINSFAICIQLTDTIFFGYVFKRSTADIFKFLSLGDDSKDLLPFVLKEYWYVLLLWAGMILLINYLYNRVDRKPIKPIEDGHHYIAAAISSYIISIGLLVLGLRGGWQLRPLSIIDAADYAPALDIPLVLNTPFSIANTMGAPPIKEYKFFSQQTAKKLYNTEHPGSGKATRKLNVVTIIMESFSKEYMGSLNNLHKTSTPFLDSLITQSLVFDDAFSDGKKSIEGIPAVVAGLPSWMDEAYITSDYSADAPVSLASLLDKIGYSTAFFHGGRNGTMGFTSFCKQIGFDYYYGYNEYNNTADFDGHWGIWDEPFFQYFAKELDTLHQPFYAAIFSLSSHHPFEVPAKYKNVFKQDGDELPILKCVRYSDMALREFFKTASQQPWYDSTLFVITADHAGPSAEAYFSNRVGIYEIPIIYYMHNSNLKGVSHSVTQHIDIMPSVLDYIHYPNPYFALGKSVFDTNANHHYAVSYINDCYQIAKGNYCLQIEGKKITALYNYEADSMLTQNLVTTQPHIRDSLAATLQAVMQTYSYDLIHNNLKLKKEN